MSKPCEPTVVNFHRDTVVNIDRDFTNLMNAAEFVYFTNLVEFTNLRVVHKSPSGGAYIRNNGRPEAAA